MTKPQAGSEFEPQPGIRGWWIVPNETFVFAPPPEKQLMRIRLPTGETCNGFDVVDLASQFGMDAGTLILNAQIGALRVTTRPLPTIGNQRRIEYTFDIHMHGTITNVVNVMPITGST